MECLQKGDLGDELLVGEPLADVDPLLKKRNGRVELGDGGAFGLLLRALAVERRELALRSAA
jgi:hypothetical protein